MLEIAPLPPDRRDNFADPIFAIMQIALPDSWNLATLRNLLLQPTCVGCIAKTDRMMIGFLLAQKVDDQLEILSFAVLPQNRRLGIGREMLGWLLRYGCDTGCREIFLDVAADNAAAMALYQSGGFAIYDRRPQYYIRKKGRIDAILMKRSV